MKSLLYGREMFKHFFLTKGAGKAKTELLAFDRALREARISNYNLVKVSSILPPNVKSTNKVILPPSSVLYIAYSYFISDKEGNLISSVIGIAMPENKNEIGMIMEWSGEGKKKEGEEKVKFMLEEAMEDRNIKIGKIKILSIQKEVKDITCVFSGCALF